MGKTARTILQGKLILRTPKVKDENKAYPVYLYYYCGGRQIRESTSISARVDDWNKDKGELRASYGSNYQKYNKYLHTQLREVDSCIFEYVEKNGSITPAIVRSFIKSDYTQLRPDKGDGFLNYALNLVKKEYKDHVIKISTYKNSESILNQFKKYMDEMNIDDTGLYVGDISRTIVRDFLEWGLNRKLKKETVEKYLELIAKVCRRAFNEGLLPKPTVDEITGIKLEDRLDDNNRKTVDYLVFEELGKLKRSAPNSLTARQTDYLDLFLFAFYSEGLRVSDVLTLRWCDIDYKKDEIFKVHVKPRAKKSVPLREEAKKILERWKGRNRVFCFDLLPENFDLTDEEELRIRRNSVTSNINRCLKRIARNAQLDKNLHFHMSRHSWSVAALEQGMSINFISEFLGHSSPEITSRVYACHTDATKAKAVNDLRFDF